MPRFPLNTPFFPHFPYMPTINQLNIKLDPPLRPSQLPQLVFNDKDPRPTWDVGSVEVT